MEALCVLEAAQRSMPSRVDARSLDILPDVIAKPVVWAEAISNSADGDCASPRREAVAALLRNDDFVSALRLGFPRVFLSLDFMWVSAIIEWLLLASALR